MGMGVPGFIGISLAGREYFRRMSAITEKSGPTCPIPLPPENPDIPPGQTVPERRSQPAEDNGSLRNFPGPGFLVIRTSSPHSCQLYRFSSFVCKSYEIVSYIHKYLKKIPAPLLRDFLPDTTGQNTRAGKKTGTPIYYGKNATHRDHPVSRLTIPGRTALPDRS